MVDQTSSARISKPSSFFLFGLKSIVITWTSGPSHNSRALSQLSHTLVSRSQCIIASEYLARRIAARRSGKYDGQRKLLYDGSGHAAIQRVLPCPYPGGGRLTRTSGRSTWKSMGRLLQPRARAPIPCYAAVTSIADTSDVSARLCAALAGDCCEPITGACARWRLGWQTHLARGEDRGGGRWVGSHRRRGYVSFDFVEHVLLSILAVYLFLERL